MKGKRLRRVVCSLSALVLAGFLGTGQSAEAAFDSPYVKAETVFDDTGMHQHWTIEEDFPYEIQSPADFYVRGKLVNPPPYWYEEGTSVSTGKTSTLRTPGQGEHYYTWKRMGEVPIGQWVVRWQPGRCIHKYSEPIWQTISTGLHPDVNGGICAKAYYSGWFAYCADCGQQLETAYVYASKEAISTITVMDMSYGYYYLCPNPDCRHLENTGEPIEHECKNVSPVMYRVVYEKNGPEDEIKGLMPGSYHMWNNATTHDGVAVDPVTRLSKIGYVRNGYTLAGWNTRPDGSGTSFGDEAEILNLCEYDYFEWRDKGDEEKGTVRLYAQWVPTSSYLHIDPNGGTYKGTTDVTKIHEGAGRTYTADPGDVVGTSHYKVNYNTNGGNPLSSAPIPEVFREWGKNADFKGKLTDGKTYKFPYVNDHIDTLTARYDYGAIVLPTPIHPSGFGFGGWYEDPGCTTNLVGFGGDSYTPREDISGDVTLYAKWVNLVLWSKENYTDNGKKGVAAPDLAAPDGIDGNKVTISSLGSVRAEVAFEKPLDNGTPYWWKVESINVLTGSKICDSNITKTTLTTGVSKYLYQYNTTASQTITDAAGCSVLNAVPGAEKDSIRLDLVYDVQYLHIAPVDVAGNIGPTIDIELNTKLLESGHAELTLPMPEGRGFLVAAKNIS